MKKLSVLLILLFAINCTTVQGKLFEGIEENDEEQINESIDEGADITALKEVDGDSMTALHFGVFSHSSIDTLKELVKLGANVNSIDRNGLTPLMYSAKYANREAAVFLIHSGSLINKQDNFGMTALMYSAYGRNANHRAIFEILTKAKADSKLKNESGLTASAFEELRKNEEKQELNSKNDPNYVTDSNYSVGPRGGLFRYNSSGKKVYDSSRSNRKSKNNYSKGSRRSSRKSSGGKGRKR